MRLTRLAAALGAVALTAGTLFAGAPAASADQVRDAEWEISYFNYDKVWSVSKGDGVIVAVIDSGVDATHPDIAGSVLPGYDQSEKGENTKPTVPHGTSMASHIVGHGHGDGVGVIGIAPGAKVLPVYKDSPDGADAVPSGIKWAVEHGAKVINLSVGRLGKPKSDRDLTEAVAYAAQHDVLIVGATGNDGVEGVHTPGNEPGVLAVGATEKTGKIWASSNYGSQVLISAPGVGIVGATPGGQYGIGDGTSDSTAFVSGTAALVRAKFPNLTAGQVAERLVKSAKVPASLQGAKLPDPHYGYGVLSPYDALTKDIPAGPAQGPLGGPYAEASKGSGGATSAATSGTGAGTGGDGTGSTSAGSGLDGIAQSDGPGAGLLIAAAGAVVVVLIVIVIIVLAAKKRRRPAVVPMQGQPPYGAPPNWPGGQPPGYPQQYGGQAPPPGYPPQPNSYQNPYGSDGGQSRR
ncbi:S8 family serine peptidase [Kitasatospora sp. NPDC057198]|uniref:S8 family serine peptidase n=1 Tax=Kitasatospora sp. NPDC057198 TaxID=3346046 RepID=UPI00363AEAD1